MNFGMVSDLRRNQHTTFSTFSLDVALMWERGELSAAGLYVLLSVLVSVAALFVGLLAVRAVA